MTDKEINSASETIANQLLDIKNRAIWQIENSLYMKTDMNKELRLQIAADIFQQTINQPMSISDHFDKLCYLIETIIKANTLIHEHQNRKQDPNS